MRQASQRHNRFFPFKPCCRFSSAKSRLVLLMPAALLQVTDYLPRLGVFTLGLPRGLEQLLEYTFKVSAVLALINMAPVIYFDGQAALDNLILPIGICSPTSLYITMALQWHCPYSLGLVSDLILA